MNRDVFLYIQGCAGFISVGPSFCCPSTTDFFGLLFGAKGARNSEELGFRV